MSQRKQLASSEWAKEVLEGLAASPLVAGLVEDKMSSKVCPPYLVC